MAAPTVAKVTSVFRQKLFKDKVALVTGGATGIGKTITQELLYLGKHFFLLFNLNCTCSRSTSFT